MNNNLKMLLSAFFMALLPSALSAQGNTLVVPDAYTSIQSAIDASSSGDTVLVSQGTYNENINFKGKNIVVSSLFLTTGEKSYISGTKIDGGQNGSSVVILNSGESSDAKLCGFSISSGRSDYGGGIYIENANPVLSFLKVTGNNAEWWGGGICVKNGSPMLNNITVSDNSAKYGGGIYILNSNTELSNLIIRNNSSIYGGGISIYNNSTCVLRNLEITDNKNTYFGSGISVIGYNNEICTAYAYNITLCNNKRNSDFYDVDNSAGIYIYNSSVNIVNSIILRNSPRNLYSGTWWMGINNIGIKYSNYSLEDLDLSNNVLNAEYLINKDPMFINTGNYPYSLKAGSPCIEAGLQDTTGLGLPDRDFAGNDRIRDGRVDMGAYEWDGVTSAFPPIPPSWTVNPAGFQNSMNVRGQVVFNSFVLADTFSYVGAFVNGECRGSAGIKDISWGITGFEMTVYGNTTGETVNFKVWNNGYEDEYLLAEAVTFTPGGSLGTGTVPVKLSYTFTTTIEGEIKTPITYKLNQNYPNPFNPETNINFTLPKQERVHLVIYDILGCRIKTLADGTYAAGVHSLKWDGRSDSGQQAASGVYIYRIVTKDFAGSKKMMYLK